MLNLDDDKALSNNADTVYIRVSRIVRGEEAGCLIQCAMTIVPGLFWATLNCRDYKDCP